MTERSRLHAELSMLEVQIRRLSDRKWHVKGLLGLRRWPRSRLEFFKRRHEQIARGGR